MYLVPKVNEGEDLVKDRGTQDDGAIYVIDRRFFCIFFYCL